MAKIEITEDQIKGIIYDARSDRQKSFNELVRDLIVWPTFDGTTQNLIEKYPNHLILIEVFKGWGERTGSYNQYFVKFVIENNEINKVPVGFIGEGWQRDYKIVYPNIDGDAAWCKPIGS